MKRTMAILAAGALVVAGSLALLGLDDVAREATVERDVAAAAPRDTAISGASNVSAPATPMTDTPESAAATLLVGSRPSSAPATHPTNSDRLVTESMLLLGSDLDSNAASNLLRAEDGFDKALGRMDDEMQRDPDAMALGDTYAQAIAAQLSSGDQALRLDRLACGLRLCVASFDDAADEAAWEAWRQRFDADTETPHSVFVERSLARPDGSVERRVIFTTDPTSLGVNVRDG